MFLLQEDANVISMIAIERNFFIVISDIRLLDIRLLDF